MTSFLKMSTVRCICPNHVSPLKQKFSIEDFIWIIAYSSKMAFTRLSVVVEIFRTQLPSNELSRRNHMNYILRIRQIAHHLWLIDTLDPFECEPKLNVLFNFNPYTAFLPFNRCCCINIFCSKEITIFVVC